MIFLELTICLVVAALFAGLETGLLAANPLILEEPRLRRKLWVRSAKFLLARPERLLGTTLIGYNIANVAAAVLVTTHMAQAGLERFTWLAVLALSMVYLLFNDLIPKSFLLFPRLLCLKPLSFPHRLAKIPFRE